MSTGSAQMGKISVELTVIDGEPCGPSGVNMMTGELVFREFHSLNHWANKASGWMGPSDILVDASGKVCRNGDDMARAVYPVRIYRPFGGQ